MIKKFLALFKRKSKQESETPFAYPVDHPTEYVFSIGETEYHQFKDISKIKCVRSFTKSDVFSELAMRCTREYLEYNCKAVDNILSNPKQINITQLAQLNQQLKERLEMIYEVDIIYKIASVVFFDKSENPYEYDDLYAREKIERFKSYARTHDGFFFETLFKNLIPTKSTKEEDLKTYMMVGEKISQKHMDNIFTILSNTKETNGLAVS